MLTTAACSKPVWTPIDPDGFVTDVNAAAEAVTGWSRAELIGTEFTNYFAEPSVARAGYHLAFRTGSVRDYALEIRHRDGHLTPVLYNAAVYRDETGKVVGVFAAARDITKQKQKDYLLTQQSRLAAMGEMMGNIAHQWRQPLNTLALTLTNIEDAYNYNELTGEYLGIQVAEGNRLIQKMSSTIDDFRNFFRPHKDAGPFSAAKAINLAISLVSATFRNNNIALELELGEDALINGFANLSLAGRGVGGEGHMA